MDPLTFDDVAALQEWAAAQPSVETVTVAFRRVVFGEPPPDLRVADVIGALGLAEASRALVSSDAYAVTFGPARVKAVVPRWADGPVSEPVLSPEYEARLRDAPGAWEFLERQPPRYRRTAIWWVMGGKAEATRERRITALVAACAAGEKIPALVRQL